MPHKRDEVFYDDDGETIVISRLGWQSNQLNNVVGWIEARHAKDPDMQYLLENVHL